MTQNLDYWLLLHSVAGMGAATFNKLLERFETPENVFAADYTELQSIKRLSKKVVNNLLSCRKKLSPNLKKMHQIITQLKKRQFKIITRHNCDYPQRLNTLENPPPIVYVYGKWTANKSIAIVGARQASVQGLKKAFEFARGLARAGLTIVSGYAKGIDTQAHLGAIKGGGKTTMVLPMGALNFTLHKEFSELRSKLWKQITILSESFPTADWTVGQAMARNRITACLADGVLVVDAGSKGGTLATARWGAKQKKPLFVSSPANSLGDKEILEIGGRLVEKPENIIAEI